SGSQGQAVLFRATGLAPGAHTLKIVVTGTHAAGSTDNYVAVDAIDVPPPLGTSESVYPTVPQQPGTAITLDGRDSDIILANTRLGGSQLQYSTSELMTSLSIGGRDIAVLYGTAGSDGETVLRYPAQPVVQGDVAATWDAASGDLRLNYTHGGLTRVTV